MLATLSTSWIVVILAAAAALLVALFGRGKKPKPRREVLTAAARRWFAEYTRAKVGSGDMSPLSASALYTMYAIETGQSPFEGDADHRQLHEFLTRQPYHGGCQDDPDAWRRG